MLQVKHAGEPANSEDDQQCVFASSMKVKCKVKVAGHLRGMHLLLAMCFMVSVYSTSCVRYKSFKMIIETDYSPTN